jgi:parallel beta-helix repeat protein
MTRLSEIPRTRPARRAPAGILATALACGFVVAAVPLAGAAQSPAHPSGRVAAAASSCIASGTDASINAALVGTGAQAVLCPGAVFNLANSVTFTAPDQEILTQGLPTGSTRAILRVDGSSLTTAVNGNGQAGVTVENIQVDGNRPNLGPSSTGGALLEMGGAGTGQIVQNVFAHDTRSWSTLHFIEGTVTNSTPQCQNGQILNNQIGPAGNPGLPGVTTGWADGISMACGDTLVKGNTVTDATDGGIVIFGAPGSTIEDNTVTAATQQLFGGINMVDYAPMNGNYTGTLVTGNTIDAKGALIKVGIGMGQQVWNCTTGTNYGATVSDNTLEGAYMGYGYPVNGVSDWTVSGNVDNSTHVGTQTAGGCFGSPAASQPAGFQVQVQSGSTLQSQYVSAELTNLLGTLNGTTASEPPSPSISVSPTGLNLGSTAVGTPSSTQPVTVKNTGSTSVDIDNITTTGVFTETDDCGGTILAAGASCTANVGFTPTASGAQSGTLTVASLAADNPVTVSLSGTGGTSGGGTPTNLALGATMTASSSASGFPPSNANDGNTSTYWESLNGAAYPQTLTANLGSVDSLGSVALPLPPSSAWSTRTETLSVLGSTNGSTWTTLVPSAGYTFNPATGNSVSFNLPAGTSEQYLQLSFTGNTGWPAAQVAEFEIYGPTPSSGGAALAASPTSLSFGNEPVGSTSAPQSATLTDTGSAAATITGITVSGPFSRTTTCGGSLAAGASCTIGAAFTPAAAGSAAGSISVAGSAGTLAIALSGTGVSTTTNLALNKPTTSSSYTQTYSSGNAVDGDTSTYWESADNAFPQWFQVDLGSTTAVASVVLDLPPATSWATRTQTILFQGSADGSTYTTLVATANYTFNPATGNTVTITLPAGTSTRYLKLTFTANTGWPAGQLSEIQAFA